MRTIISFVLFTALISSVTSQSRSIESFSKEFEESFSLALDGFSINLLNDENDNDLAGVLRNIQKLKIFTYPKNKTNISKSRLNLLTNSIRKENYSDLMTINNNNEHIILLCKEKQGKISAIAGVIDQDESIIIIDIKGTIKPEDIVKIKDAIDREK